MIKGFITGSFRPFHKGHEALIDYAKEHCDELTILITTLPDEVIPYKYRLKWVLSTYLDDPQITIVADVIHEPKITGDALSGWWGNYVKTKYGQFDRVFTSEAYGDMFALAMEAEHWRFNQARTIVPISGTTLRKRPITNWDYLNNFAKDYFVKKFVIVGSESTGKTTLVKRLAEHYNTVYVEDHNSTFVPEIGRDLVSHATGLLPEDEKFAHEIGRDLIADPNKCTLNDLKMVGVEHAKHIIKCTRLAHKILIVDTDLTITKSYAKFLFGEVPHYEPWVEAANKMDFYIYLQCFNVPFVQDGTRLSEKDRNELSKHHLEMYREAKIKVQPFGFYTTRPFNNENPWERRFKEIVEYIDWELSKL